MLQWIEGQECNLSILLVGAVYKCKMSTHTQVRDVTALKNISLGMQNAKMKRGIGGGGGGGNPMSCSGKRAQTLVSETRNQ